ncbi:YqhA family protein [Haematobacter missouriensis]|uniref:YqhA family protein n=1 Tax=Haematobacter missouriensis TaxID=366616 RepID=UPI001FCFEDC4|nr:YqhA family protein [Haematobacter missouriensis]
MILGTLVLTDLTLPGNLVLIVIFSGYGNFVSKMNMDGHEDRHERQGRLISRASSRSS